MSAPELLLALKTRRPDVLLMDADLPDMDGLKLLALVRRSYPEIKVGILFGDRDQTRIHSALAAGAAACVMKNVHPDDLPAAIRQVVEATVLPASSFPDAVAASEPQTVGDLTEREMTMLKAIAQDMSNKAISREHWVTEQTVKFHLNNVYRKLGVPNRTAAARLACQHGLLDGDVAASTRVLAFVCSGSRRRGHSACGGDAAEERDEHEEAHGRRERGRDVGDPDNPSDARHVGDDDAYRQAARTERECRYEPARSRPVVERRRERAGDERDGEKFNRVHRGVPSVSVATGLARAR